MNKLFASIDPGNKGAVIIFSSGNKSLSIEEIYEMPILKTQGKGKTKKGNTKTHTVLDEQELRGILTENPISHIYIEKSQSMPGQGAPATFNYACSYGIIRGICIGLQIPYTLIHPATWKRVMMKDMDKGKDAAIVRAKQLFPALSSEIGKHDGIAEAILIGYYGEKNL